jgi:hypothetical protein
VTTDTLGHVTDANGTVATRTLTPANIGAVSLGSNDTITSVKKITSAGNLIYEKSSIGGFVPVLAQTINSGQTQTGAIKLRFPSGSTTDMICGWVDIYNYTSNDTVSIFIGGYLYQGAGANEWVSESVTTLCNNTSQDFTVRFGHDGTQHCIYIGELTTTWSYSQITARDWTIGYSADIDAYATGTTITYEASAFQNVDATKSGNLPVASSAASATTAASCTGNSATATWADTVDVNSGQSSQATYYDVVWHSGDTVYSTPAVDIQPNSGTLRATTFSGSGSGLSSLNASNISSCTISDARLPATISSNITGSSASCTGNAATATTATNVTGITRNVGDYGSIAANTLRGGYYGLSCNGHLVLMSDGGATHGIYDDVNNDWWVRFYENAGVTLNYNGAARVASTSAGVTITGAVTATGGNSTNWNTAHGWGNHASAGYGVKSTNESVSGRWTFTNGIGAVRVDGVYVTPTTYLYGTQWKFTEQAQLNSPPGSGSWRHVLNIQTWSQHSSSYPSYQMSFGSGAIGVRQSTSNTAWGAWKTLATTDGTVANATNATTAASCTGNSATATLASTVTVNSSTSAAWYDVLWASGNTVYGQSNVEIYPNGGYLRAVYLNMTHGSTTRNSDSVFFSGTSDGYIRKNDATGFRSSLNVPTRTGGNASGTWGINITGSAATATDSTKLPLAGGTMTGLIIGRVSNVSTIATANDSGSISVRGNTTRPAVMSFHRAGAYAVNFGLSNSNVMELGGWSAGTIKHSWDMAGNYTAVGNVTAYSDIKLKDNIELIPDAVSKVQQLRGVTFDRNDFVPDAETGVMPETRQAGVIAQEVQKVLPEVVTETNDGTLTVAYGNMVGLLIEAIKEQQAQIDELKEMLSGATS